MRCSSENTKSKPRPTLQEGVKRWRIAILPGAIIPQLSSTGSSPALGQQLLYLSTRHGRKSDKVLVFETINPPGARNSSTIISSGTLHKAVILWNDWLPQRRSVPYLRRKTLHAIVHPGYPDSRAPSCIKSLNTGRDLVYYPRRRTVYGTSILA